MKKKILTRPVCVMLSQEMYQQVSKLTDQQEISVPAVGSTYDLFDYNSNKTFTSSKGGRETGCFELSRHRLYNCCFAYSATSSLNIRYRYFGHITMWYLHSYIECDNFLNRLFICTSLQCYLSGGRYIITTQTV